MLVLPRFRRIMTFKYLTMRTYCPRLPCPLHSFATVNGMWLYLDTMIPCFASAGTYFFFAHYSRRVTGCTVVAYNLDTGQRFWTSELEALGNVPHSAYRNQVTMELAPEAVWIRGHELAGDYIEVLNRITGKCLGHKVYGR